MADDRKQTAYKVLVPRVTSEPQVEHGEWREMPGVFAGSNDIAAIGAAEAEHGPFDHGALAVPIRNWHVRHGKDEKRRVWK